MARVPWMLFVDGKNFTRRGREVADTTGVRLIPGPYYVPERFLWLPNLTVKKLSIRPLNAPVLDAAADRACYFTGVQGSSETLTQTEAALDALGFDARVFRREKNKQSKRVDVALTTTMLSHAVNGDYEVAVLVTGDEDFVPLVEEVKRRGKKVYGWFFRGAGSGLSDELYRSFDRMMNMDQPFRECWMPAVAPAFAFQFPPQGSREVSS